MPSDILLYSLVFLAYLIGSISAAILVCRWMGLPDPRSEGSMNPGATNVLRIGGKKAAFFTLLGDFLKSFIPVLIGHSLGASYFMLFLIGFAAFLGHLYPLFFKFKGGKGVATAMGVYFAIHGLGGLLVAGTWLFVAKVLKISSLAALVATLLAPLYFYFITHSWPLTAGLALMTLVIYWRHRSNIRNMLAGTEGSIKT